MIESSALAYLRSEVIKLMNIGTWLGQRTDSLKQGSLASDPKTSDANEVLSEYLIL